MSRLLSGLLATTLLIVLTPWPSAVAHAATVPIPTAYDQVASCLNARGSLAVLALVDESGSLRDTDPRARRVDALVGMLRTLARYGTRQASATRTVEIELAGFGSTFQPGTWADLNLTTNAGLESQARRFTRRNTDQDTDFAVALLGAQEEFVKKDAATGGEPPCRLLVMFTDGVYDLVTTNTDRPYAAGLPRTDLAAIKDRGEHTLCDAGGVLDQLRTAGTVIVAIGLVSGQSQDQDFLRSTAQRDSPGGPCGTVDSPPGDYVPVNDVGGLLAAFDAAILPSLGGTPQSSQPPVAVCPPNAPVDSRCSRHFALDPSLSEFHLLLDLGSPQIAVRLQPPAGDPVELTTADPPATHPVGGAALATSTLTSSDLVVDGTLPAANLGWAGTWTVSFIDTTGQNQDAVANSQLVVFGALAATTEPAPPRFEVGKRTDFRIRITDAAGAPRTPAGFIQSAQVSAVVAAQGASTDVTVGPMGPDGTYGASYVVPPTTVSSFVDLKLILVVTTTNGLRLRPRVTTYRVPVTQPAAYPAVSPPDLWLNPIIGTGTATGELSVTGGRAAGECVWLAVAFGQIVPDSGAPTTRFTPDATAPSRCLPVAPGRTATVRIETRPRLVRSGVDQGIVTATLTARGMPARTVAIPVRFVMESPINAGKRWTLFVAIVAGGVLFPLLLLWLVSRLIARFTGPGQRRWAERGVVVTENAVLDAKTRRPIHDVLDGSSFTAMASSVPTGRCVGFTHGALTFGRRIPLLPWLLPYGTVRSAGAFVLTGLGSRSIRLGRVGFDLSQIWVLAVDRVQPANTPPVELHGRLFFFVTDFGVAAKARKLIETAAADIPDLAAVVRSQVEVTSVGATPDRATYQPPI
jgi:hypothetical protein